MRVNNALNLTAILNDRRLTWSAKLDKVMSEADIPSRTKAARMLNRARIARRHGDDEIFYRHSVHVRW